MIIGDLLVGAETAFVIEYDREIMNSYKIRIDSSVSVSIRYCNFS